MQGIIFDTGVISIYISENSRDKQKIITILNGSLKNQYQIHILTPIITELFSQICYIKGKEVARSIISSLLTVYPIMTIEPDKSILFKAGELKCQYRSLLSYNDCLMIATAMIRKMAWYTTEKKIKAISPDLIRKLNFQTFFWD